MGADVTIVSDGFGLRVHDVGAGVGVPVVTNAVNWDSFELTFPYADPTCPCAQCGVCKQTPIRAAQEGGQTTVLIGDGASDAKAAEVADIVFATGQLATWCRREGIAHRPFTGLSDLLAQLGEDAAEAPR